MNSRTRELIKKIYDKLYNTKVYSTDTPKPTNKTNKLKAMKNLTIFSAIVTTSILTASSAFAGELGNLKVSATYNTVDKRVTPTISISTQVLPKLRVNGWVNFKKGLNVSQTTISKGSTYVAEAAYTVQDARDRFGIVTPIGVTDISRADTLYSADGTRLDKQPITGFTADGSIIKAKRTLVTAAENTVIDGTAVESPQVVYGADLKYEVVNDASGLIALGVGVKSNGKAVAPYIAAEGELKLKDALSFFADVRVPFDNTGADVSAGIKLSF
jgi:hypothetical protein